MLYGSASPGGWTQCLDDTLAARMLMPQAGIQGAVTTDIALFYACYNRSTFAGPYTVGSGSDLGAPTN